MIIPHQRLSPEALRGVIEAFVSREGTDYGEYEVPLASKVLQVRKQLDEGTAVIVYDQESASCTVQPRNRRAAPSCNTATLRCCQDRLTAKHCHP